ncbi:virulence RhuM family protein [Candidatus Margulisiibacteriota bacterium]
MNNEIVLYKSEDGKLNFDVRLDKDTVWLRQAQIAELFGTRRPAVTKHLSNIFKTNELKEVSVSSILEHTAKDGKVYKTKFYNLDAIIAIGYRINSYRATEFRIWATSVLRNYLLNGYAVNFHKMRKIEEKIDFLIKEGTLQKKEIIQLQEDHLFIKKMIKPNFVVNNYIDAKPIIEANKQNTSEIKAKFDELNNILKDIETKLPKSSELKAFIKEVQEDSKNADRSPESQSKIINFIQEIGNQESTAYRLLASAGIAKSIITKVYEIGLFLIQHLPI